MVGKPTVVENMERFEGPSHLCSIKMTRRVVCREGGCSKDCSISYCLILGIRFVRIGQVLNAR